MQEEQSGDLNISSSVIQIMRVIVRIDRACNSQIVIVVRNLLLYEILYY